MQVLSPGDCHHDMDFVAVLHGPFQLIRVCCLAVDIDLDERLKHAVVVEDQVLKAGISADKPLNTFTDRLACCFGCFVVVGKIPQVRVEVDRHAHSSPCFPNVPQ